MASFYWKRHSDQSLFEQWKKHRQTQAYVNDITGAIENQTKNYSTSIENISKEHLASTMLAMENVCGTISSGLSVLSSQLDDVTSGIDGIKSVLDWGLSTLIEEQRQSNILLNNSVLTMRIPENQKERQYHLEQGIRFLKNAQLTDTSFYEDALENLKKAEALEKTDYFVLHRIGLIYLYSANHLDLECAEHYFKRATKYTAADTHPDALKQANLLVGNSLKNLEHQQPSNEAIKILASQSAYQQGLSIFLQERTEDSIDLFSKSISLYPENLDAKFAFCKSHLCLENDELACRELKDLILADMKYAIAAASDPDFATNRKVQALLEAMRNDSLTKAKSLLRDSQAGIGLLVNEWQIENSVHYRSFLQLADKVKMGQSLIAKSTYIDSLKAQKHLITFLSSIQ